MLCGDFVNVCPAFGRVSPLYQNCWVFYEPSAKRTPSWPVFTWLHCNCLLHWSLLPCGKGLFFHGYTHALTHTHILFTSGLYTLLKSTDLQLHNLSQPATIQVVAIKCRHSSVLFLVFRHYCSRDFALKKAVFNNLPDVFLFLFFSFSLGPFMYESMKPWCSSLKASVFVLFFHWW